MRKWVLLAVLLVLLLGAIGFGVILFNGGHREDPDAPLAPDAPEAPVWPTPQATPSGNQGPQETLGQTPPEGPAEKPLYQWPADFKLPLQITIRDVPELPKRLTTPPPPEQ